MGIRDWQLEAKVTHGPEKNRLMHFSLQQEKSRLADNSFQEQSVSIFYNMLSHVVPLVVVVGKKSATYQEGQ